MVTSSLNVRFAVCYEVHDEGSTAHCTQVFLARLVRHSGIVGIQKFVLMRACCQTVL